MIVFGLLWKFAFPALNKMLAERSSKIQGEMERAEATRGEADRLLADYRSQLAGARDESNRIIEEARKTADQLRRDVQAKAEQEAQATVARAQEEIRAERDRVFAGAARPGRRDRRRARGPGRGRVPRQVGP